MTKHKRKSKKKECWMCVNVGKEVPMYCWELKQTITQTEQAQAEDCLYFDYDETEMEALEEE